MSSPQPYSQAYTGARRRRVGVTGDGRVSRMLGRMFSHRVSRIFGRMFSHMVSHELSFSLRSGYGAPLVEPIASPKSNPKVYALSG